MADDRQSLLERHYGPSDYMGNLAAGEPLPASASGGWDEPPPPPAPPPPSHNIGWHADRYLEGLPNRIMLGLREKGLQMANDPAAYRRSTPIVGDALLGKDAIENKDWWGAALHGLSAAGDLAAAPASKVPVAGKLALEAWRAALDARPGLVREMLESMTTPRMKSTGKAAEKRAADAERRVPQAKTPDGISPEEATRRLAVGDRTWPGNALLASAGPAIASGVPGVVVDDIKGSIGSANDAYQKTLDDAKAEKAAEQQLRAGPRVEGSNPEVDSYWSQLDTPRRERDRHIAAAAAMGAAGPLGAAATAKTIPWAARNMMPAAVGLGAQLAMEHPLLALIGLPFMAAGALPWAVPGGLGYGTYKLAEGTQGQIDQALKKHDQAKALAPLVRMLQENYRADQPRPPSLTPDQSY